MMLKRAECSNNLRMLSYGVSKSAGSYGEKKNSSNNRILTSYLLECKTLMNGVDVVLCDRNWNG